MTRSIRRFFLCATFLTLGAATLMTAAPAAAKGGGGFAIKPGFVPHYSIIDVPTGAPVTFALGGRGVKYIGPFFRLGGEGYYDFQARIGSGGFLAEAALPLPGPVEIDLGGVIGGGSYGLYVEPGLTLQIGKGPFAVDVRLSYQWHPMRTESDTVRFHRGLTYLTVAFMFGNFG